MPLIANFCPKCGTKVDDSLEEISTPNIEVLDEKSQATIRITDNSEFSQAGIHYGDVDVSPTQESTKDSFNFKGLGVITLIIVFVLIVMLASKNQEPQVQEWGSTTNAEVPTPVEVIPKIDCSKVGGSPNFDEMQECNLNGDGSKRKTSDTGNSASSKLYSNSIEGAIRIGLVANCTNLPANFENLIFQSRGQTFNSYGNPLDLYSLGDTNLTYLDEDSTARVGYADASSYSTLNMWQCFFPFDIEQ